MWSFPLVLLLPLFWLLNYFGLAVRKTVLFGAGNFFPFPTSWRGSFHILTGTLARNFRVFSGYDRLSVVVEGISGTLEVEISDGEVLFSRQGRIFSGEIPLAGHKRLRCRVRGEEFRGKVRIEMKRSA